MNEAYRELYRNTQNYISDKNIAGVFEEVICINGFQITVRGKVVEGVARIGTAFIAK